MHELGILLYCQNVTVNLTNCVLSMVAVSVRITMSVSRRVVYCAIPISVSEFEPPHGKNNNLHRRKQRRRSASQ